VGKDGKVLVSKTTVDFGAFASKSKKGGGGGTPGKPNGNMTLPTTVVPGAFRTASEAGRPGGGAAVGGNAGQGQQGGGGGGGQQMSDSPPSGGKSVGGGSPMPHGGQQQIGMNSQTSSVPPGADGYGPTEYPFVPPTTYEMDYSGQSATTDHMAYLKGPVAGGGFNAKDKHLQKSIAQANSVPTDDIEGKGLMLKGNDGHMYYKDLNDN
jgi:hypothetical protein